MLSTVLALSLVSLVPSAPGALPTAPPRIAQEEGAEVQQAIDAAGDDVAKLEALAQGYKDAERDEDARTVYRRILELAPEHEEAHKGLRHHAYDGKWFESYAALSKYKREEAQRMKEEFGLVRYQNEWVPEADLPFLRMGWTKDGDVWKNPVEAARAEEEARRKAEGWLQQTDLVWVPADEAENWNEGRWKCGEQWLSQEEADAYHATIGQWWTYPAESFLVLSTLSWDSTRWAGWYADQVVGELDRIFGLQPAKKPEVVVLSSVEQYNAFSAGDQAAGRPGAEVSGYSSLHYAFFADAWVDVVGQTPVFHGAGVAYWNTNDPALAPFGQFAVRHAAAHSWLEAVDPSWNAISEAIANQQAPTAAAFWAEKRIPLWLRYGAASYVERYLEDKNAGDGGDPWGFRSWALDNVRNKGGLRPLDQIFAFNLSLDDLDGSTRLIQEAGLLVSFVMDGGCAPVREAHAALRRALVAGEPTAEAVAALQKAIADNQEALTEHAGL